MPDTKTDVTKAIQALVGIGVFVYLLWFFMGGGWERQTSDYLQDIENKVAADAVAQYGIANRNGTPMDKCVQAGLVAAAFLQAEDEPNYAKWKQIELTDCRAAGLQK